MEELFQGNKRLTFHLTPTTQRGQQTPVWWQHRVCRQALAPHTKPYPDAPHRRRPFDDTSIIFFLCHAALEAEGALYEGRDSQREAAEVYNRVRI